jgi:hypothetical protein
MSGLILVDWKTGEPAPATGLQLAAYARLFLTLTGQAVAARLAVQLSADGSFRIHRYADPNDWNTFSSALRVSRWRQQHLPQLAEVREREA